MQTIGVDYARHTTASPSGFKMLSTPLPYIFWPNEKQNIHCTLYVLNADWLSPPDFQTSRRLWPGIGMVGICFGLLPSRYYLRARVGSWV